MFFNKVFHKGLVKTVMNDAVSSIFMFYCHGRHFSSRRFEIIKFDKY